MNKIKTQFIITVECSECGEPLIKSHKRTREEIRNRWVSIVMSSPLNTPRCPKCKTSTYSDCNAHTSLVIRYAKSNRKVNEDWFFERN